MSNAMEDWQRQHRITVDEYHRMAECGVLAPDARVELIEGVIIDMAPLGSAHGTAVDLLTELLVPAVKGAAIVRTQGALRLGWWDEPQPDIALLKPRADRYRNTNPGGLDTYLIIEVSDATFSRDYNIKVPRYARSGVPEVWIVDVNERAVHFFRSPTGLGYTDIGVVFSPGVIAVPFLDSVAVDLTHLFDDPDQ